MDDEKALRIFVDLWMKENDIKTNKLMIFFLVQAILVGSIQFAGDKLYLTTCLGTFFSFIWYFCIGRTVAFQRHWKNRIDGLVTPENQFFPTLTEKNQFPIYGKFSAKVILLGPPFAGAVMWLIASVIVLTRIFSS